MQVDARYDLIVVGEQLSGYLLAAGAAQAGLKVLVIDDRNISTALYEVPSGNFLTDINWEPVIGLGDHSEQFLKSLGLYQDIDELFPRFTPSVQMVSPKMRVDYNYDSQTLQKEWHREAPENKHLQKFAKKIGEAAAKEKHFSNMVLKSGLGVEWEQLGQMQSALYGSLVLPDIPVRSFHASVRRAAQGVRYIWGGRSSLKERLLGRLQVFGGTVKRHSRVEEVVFEKGRLAGVLLRQW
jgi:phytoene dehydrogenase-like protein